MLPHLRSDRMPCNRQPSMSSIVSVIVPALPYEDGYAVGKPIQLQSTRTRRLYGWCLTSLCFV